MNQIIRLSLLGLLLVLMQVFLANQMVLFETATPYIFLLFLLFFPLTLPIPAQYVVGFGVGLLVDWLSLQGPVGLHAFCGTMLMALRPPLITLIGSSAVSTRGTGEIRLEKQQPLWYLTYFFPLLLIYISWYIFLEAMALTPFWLLAGKVVGTTTYTLLLCLILTYIFFRKS